jgi:adenine-specific DNA-methyltransferase
VRLRKVVDGDQTGISKEAGWQGGGSFVTATLRNDANEFRERVQAADGDAALQALLDEARQSSFLSYRVDPSRLNPKGKNFKELSQAHKRQLLLELVDSNTLYVNYSDIDDVTYGVSADDKRHNHGFYGREG